MVQGPSNDLGAALVRDPRIKAVGFTGSRQGGMALIAVAQARSHPIPVYAEMSSVNPVVLMSAALSQRGDELAKSYAASLALGAGQFCTNPGVVLAIEGPPLDRFIMAAADTLGEVSAQTMLTRDICGNYRRGLARAAAHPAVKTVAGTIEGAVDDPVFPALLTVSGTDFLGAPELAEEIFGPVSLVVRCSSLDQIAEILRALEGQLTATIHIDQADETAAVPLVRIMEMKAGRVLANGWPTGVEVSHAMVHGGPFPATSDPRTTSVGAYAIDRFLRPVCYQNMPDALLPEGLKSSDPLSLPRYVS
jgi:NADP-dependent aldehyde dehydrogenase